MLAERLAEFQEWALRTPTGHIVDVAWLDMAKAAGPELLEEIDRLRAIVEKRAEFMPIEEAREYLGRCEP